ncbi:MAG: hypothetical protein JWM98_1339 [Thermoleophilia bacterium]|nr:hypothetical protein [Thermoleophilia bacterium]
MTSPTAEPTSAQVAAIDRFVDALYDLLHERAQSIGVMDIGLEVNGFHVDGELLFTTGPDMGFSFDSQLGECRYCRLVGDDAEEWQEEVRGDLLVLDGAPRELLDAAALELLDGMLAARRPLLRGDGV